jgi:hypothetical protein
MCHSGLCCGPASWARIWSWKGRSYDSKNIEISIGAFIRNKHKVLMQAKVLELALGIQTSM